MHLLDDPYRVVLPAGHALAAQSAVALGELAREPWVRGDPADGACARIVRDACLEAGFDPAFAVDSEDYATAQGFVAAGLGVALLPRTGLEARHPGVVVREFSGRGPLRPVCVALPETGAPARAEPAVLEGLLTAFLEVGAEVGGRGNGVK
ncbi:LysR substrate-binding domain-containing protein [Streptomyces iconiensis]|uniref:LysR substrate-binding domain-containing protein n=1 Tax=Streptomyces iconiensis TaxID=1384038 RepID=A0ABT6ZRW9_9ACTN|nr:LysR substrate-binding domain-containing protein [Streptomyces iconiensis]MDJ1131529.1 LysR substrate-binding domain-containing protein [Streptomyces iconiensis]